jgi:response regulator NasT
LSEPEAFRWIQKASMDRRMTMKEVAEVIIADAQSVSGSGSAGQSSGAGSA